MVREIVVSQLMDKRPEPTGLDPRENRRQRPPVEVNLELRYRMGSNWPVGHFPYKDDIDEVTCALPRSQIGSKLLGGGTICGIVVDVSMKGIAWISHSDAPSRSGQGQYRPQDRESNPKTRSSCSHRQAFAIRAAHATASTREGRSRTVKPPSSGGAQG